MGFSTQQARNRNDANNPNKVANRQANYIKKSFFEQHLLDSLGTNFGFSPDYLRKNFKTIVRNIVTGSVDIDRHCRIFQDTTFINSIGTCAYEMTVAPYHAVYGLQHLKEYYRNYGIFLNKQQEDAMIHYQSIYNFYSKLVFYFQEMLKCYYDEDMVKIHLANMISELAPYRDLILNRT